MDALADVLKTIHMHTSTYFCADFSTPWGMDVERGDEGLFHVVVKGECWLQIQGSIDTIHLQAGDIVAFPSGGAHWISDHKDSPRLAGNLVVENIMAGANPFTLDATDPVSTQFSNNTIMCGAFSYDTKVKHPFIRDLPCFIHIKSANNPELQWLNTLIDTLANEAKTPAPGSTVMVDRLTEVLFIHSTDAQLRAKPPRRARVLGSLKRPANW